MLYLITTILLLVYLVLVWLIVHFLPLHGSEVWILRGVLALLGIIGGAVAYFYVYKVNKAKLAAARVIGAEPTGADDAARSFAAARLIPLERANTIADGLRGSLSPATFAHIRRGVDEIVTVSEATIVEAMRALWETLKVVVEPSAAVTYAAILEGKVDVRGKRVGIVLTGGNVDLDRLPWAAE